MATAEILDRARRGDAEALNELMRRFDPLLRRWAHGRLPAGARQTLDTDDLVQVTLMQAVKHIGSFQPRHEGAFLAYLRRSLVNRIRDEIRRAGRRRDGWEIPPTAVDPQASPIADLVGKETLEAYENGLARLTEPQREAVILRVEFGYGYEQIAEAMEAPSAAAARMLVVRGLARLAEMMS
jgi:RNA polymerase sigma-70 factor (ECF subfamily)